MRWTPLNISPVDLGIEASVSEDVAGYSATGSLFSSSRNNLPAVMPSLSVNWVYVLPVVIRCYQSSTTHACTCALTPAANLYSTAMSRACVSWQTNKANSRFDGEETRELEFERSLTIIPTLYILAERWFSLLRSEIKYPPHWVFVTVPLQSRSDFTSLCGGSLILIQVFFYVRGGIFLLLLLEWYTLNLIVPK